ARRREGGRRAGARTPPDPAARALGAAHQRRRPRARSARLGADAARRVKRTASPKLGAYAGLAALGLLAALSLGRPELAVLASPFALLLFAGLAATREPEVLVWLELDRDRVVEGDIVTITVDLQARTPVERLELHIPLADSFELVE